MDAGLGLNIEHDSIAIGADGNPVVSYHDTAEGLAEFFGRHPCALG